MNSLIEKYKLKISECQRKQKYYESTGRGGMCVQLNGKIQAYNEVISDLKDLSKKEDCKIY